MIYKFSDKKKCSQIYLLKFRFQITVTSGLAKNQEDQAQKNECKQQTFLTLQTKNDQMKSDISVCTTYTTSSTAYSAERTTAVFWLPSTVCVVCVRVLQCVFYLWPRCGVFFMFHKSHQDVEHEHRPVVLSLH